MIDIEKETSPFSAELGDELQALMDTNAALEENLLGNEALLARLKDEFDKLKKQTSRHLWELTAQQQEDTAFEKEGVHPDTLAAQDMADISHKDVKTKKSSSTIKRAR